MSISKIIAGGMIHEGAYHDIMINPVSGVVTFQDIDTPYVYVLQEILVTDPMVVDGDSLRANFSNGTFPFKGIIYTSSCVYVITSDSTMERRGFDKIFTGPGELIEIDLNAYEEDEE